MVYLLQIYILLSLIFMWICQCVACAHFEILYITEDTNDHDRLEYTRYLQGSKYSTVWLSNIYKWHSFSSNFLIQQFEDNDDVSRNAAAGLTDFILIYCCHAQTILLCITWFYFYHICTHTAICVLCILALFFVSLVNVIIVCESKPSHDRNSQSTSHLNFLWVLILILESTISVMFLHDKY